MKRVLKTFGTLAGVVAVILVAYISGRLSGNARMTEQMKRETSGSLGLHVETLARLRTGDIEGAEKLLEQSVDVAVVTLPQGLPFVQEPTLTQNVLMAAKTYRVAYATQDASANAVLKDVQPLPIDHKYCSPALGEVAKRSAARIGS